jgi:hypothetical protein
VRVPSGCLGQHLQEPLGGPWRLRLVLALAGAGCAEEPVWARQSVPEHPKTAVVSDILA